MAISNEHGYGELKEFLKKLKGEFQINGNSKFIELIEYAISFGDCSSAIEFLGESRIALKKIISDKPKISKDVMKETIQYKKLLDESFKDW